MASSNPVPKLYQSVIDDVVTNVREAFLDDGVDEQVLQELRQLWESKLNQSKAVDPIAADSKELVGRYTQQQQQLLQQKQQQQSSTSAGQAVAAGQSQVAPKPQTVTPASIPATISTAQVQLPSFNQSVGHYEVSGAAAQAQNALGGLIPGGTVTLQTPNGPMQFIIQAPAQQQSGTVTLPAGVVTTQHPGQVDGQDDHDDRLQSSSPSHTQRLHTDTPAQHAKSRTHSGENTPQSRLAETENRLHQTENMENAENRLPQTDGRHDSSSDDDDDDDDDNDDDDANDDENEDGGDEQEEEPLNSGDDVSEDDPVELFDTDNVVVCQFDKINRAKNRWKFHLKDGIMNLNGRDLVFQKCNGDAEW